jgi:signal transduction histidine kinase
MQPHAAERRHLERHISFARPIFVLMALLDVLVVSPARPGMAVIIFLGTYGAFAAYVAVLEFLYRWGGKEVPLAVDLAVLFLFLLLTPSSVAFWYLFLFVAFAAGTRWGIRPAVVLSGAATLALIVRTSLDSPQHLREMISWVAFSAGTFAAGVGLAFLGARQRRHAAETEYLAQLSGALEVERGLAETLRRLLEELATHFECERALLVFHDRELSRLFIWKVRRGENVRITPENVPVARADSFFLDAPDASFVWNSLDGEGEGFGWDRHTGDRLVQLPRLPGPARQELEARSLMTAALEFDGRPDARLLLLNGKSPFTPFELRWLERIVRHLSPPLENLVRLRYLRARTIEAERNRVSHDLHDGVLQTLLGLDIQLEVMRRKHGETAVELMPDLAKVQQVLRREGQELRRMVNDLRPQRVGSADLNDLMRGFGERFRAESAIPLELLAEPIGPEVSDRICRELFQIYREALHNIKKHARATHVVVKLWQDEAKVCLMVDDNGQGFSFAGRFTSDELDRLRLGPISIKERARSVGGVLTVESHPGHGARITVEVPLN